MLGTLQPADFFRERGDLVFTQQRVPMPSRLALLVILRRVVEVRLGESCHSLVLKRRCEEWTLFCLGA